MLFHTFDQNEDSITAALLVKSDKEHKKIWFFITKGIIYHRFIDIFAWTLSLWGDRTGNISKQRKLLLAIGIFNMEMS